MKDLTWMGLLLALMAVLAYLQAPGPNLRRGPREPGWSCVAQSGTVLVAAAGGLDTRHAGLLVGDDLGSYPGPGSWVSLPPGPPSRRP